MSELPTGHRAEPPRDRDRVLAQVGEGKGRIYAMVRSILDDLEAVAPWDGLYYPPTDAEEFLNMEHALVAMIEDIPNRVERLTAALRDGELDSSTRELVDNAEFYFHGIKVSVASELEKLQAKLAAFQASAASPTSVERTYTCELSADLKGKYTSSIMGAAASLIAEGRWNGIEIEPILFPEKAEEFDRNETLVTRLSQVTEITKSFLDQVPVLDLVTSWKAGHRVDQYALAPLYSLLGDLGKLMQFSSRRALYSGDYHQIQEREVQLSARINQLTSLHSMTWRTGEEADRAEDSVYQVMVENAVELAAILDVEILKKVIGDSLVKDLFAVVTAEKSKSAAGDTDEQKAARRQRIPKELHPLIPLLYDEDLKTFLELLLGSVLKRASLTVQRQDPQPVPAAAPAAPAVAESDLAAVDLEPPELLASMAEDPLLADATLSPPPPDLSLGAAAASAAAASAAAGSDHASAPPENDQLPSIDTPASHVASPQGDAWPPPDEIFPPQDQWSRVETGATGDRFEALNQLLSVLQPLLSRDSSNRKSFELVRRLLNQKRTIPAGLLQSMRPYLYDVMNELIPQLRDDARLGEAFADHGASLFGHCQILCDPNLSPDSGLADVPAVMEQVLDLLNRLAITARSSVERASA